MNNRLQTAPNRLRKVGRRLAFAAMRRPSSSATAGSDINVLIVIIRWKSLCLLYVLDIPQDGVRENIRVFPDNQAIDGLRSSA